MKLNSTTLQLSSSAIVVILAGLMYGINPSQIMPFVFGFSVEALELKNIFRAIMGLYIGCGIYWMIGALKPRFTEGAIISCMLFMGGIGFGRLVSLITDGFSLQWTIAMIAELGYAAWAFYNLKKYKRPISEK